MESSESSSKFESSKNVDVDSTSRTNTELSQQHMIDESEVTDSNSTMPMVLRQDAGLALPHVILVIGMAGSGKTALVKALCKYLKSTAPPTFPTRRDIEENTTPRMDESLVESVEDLKTKCYTINLDPAVTGTPYTCNIDIRDTVNYKEVMKQYRLGPNGAIMTCLNLFATKFDSVLNLLEKRSSKLHYIIIDTPGQIEAFNWSASGTIILETLAASFPTTTLYVIDTVKCERAVSFTSNMLYSCSILYKSKLPLICCFNKADINSPSDCFSWMSDYDKLVEGLSSDETYMASLSRSCALALTEFYCDLRRIGTSAVTGVGLPQLKQILLESYKEYYKNYVPWLRNRRQEIMSKRKDNAERDLARFARDVEE